MKSLISQDINLILVVFVISVISVFIYWRKAISTPILETKIFGFAFIANCISMALAAFSFLLIGEGGLGVFTIRLSYVFVSITGILIISSFYFPSVHDPTYKHFIIYGFAIVQFSLTGYENYNHLGIEIVNNSVKLMLSSNAIILQAISGIILIIFISFRYYQVNLISSKKKESQTSSNVRIIKLILFISVYFVLTAISIMITRILNTSSISWFLLSSLFFLFLSILMSKDIAFFFITTAELDSIILYDSSGLSLYSKNFKEENSSELLITGLLTVLNISLKDMIQSTTQIKAINFGDKSLIISPQSWTTTLMIVSESNFMTLSLSKYIGKRFESCYSSSRQSNVVAIHNYNDFNKTLEEIRYYIPF